MKKRLQTKKYASYNKKMYKDAEKNEKGITLIALVITIIVLLILAGITIITLTGENGTLSRAQDTKGTNAYATACEQARLAYMSVKTEIMMQKVKNSSYNAQNDSQRYVTMIGNEVKGTGWSTPTYNSTSKEIEITYTNSSLREGMVETGKPAQAGEINFKIGLLEQDATLSIDGELVSGEGDSQSSGGTAFMIKDSTGNPIDMANIASYYGHDVTYNGKTYQLFLVDTAGKYSNGEPRIWLQHKTYVPLSATLQTYYETTGIADANSILWQVNPDLDSAYGSTIRGLNSTTINGNFFGNLRAVAYLCNPNNWNTEYVGTAGVSAGAYAIGGVSAEMYCDSYNQFRNKTTSDADYFSAKAYNENITYGYRYKPGKSNASPNSEGYGYWTDNTNYQIVATTANTMYRINTNPWLASPSSYDINSVCFVRGDYGNLNYGNVSHTFGVRPAVSLPSDIELRLNQQGQ